MRLGGAWQEALSAGRPVVLEVKTDPEVPPLPPHITLAQAKAFATSVAKGDSEAAGVIRGTAKEVLASLLPGDRS
jgi:pyruvate dehydrogenase (quinone)